MRKLTVLLLVLLVSGIGFAQDTTPKETADVPARLDTKVIKLKGPELSNAYYSAIRRIVREDYSTAASIDYDQMSNVLVITATPITIEKVERLLNKVDVRPDSLTFLTYILQVDGTKQFDAGLDKTVVKELKEIDINGAKIIYKSRLKTISGKSLSASMIPDNSAGYRLGFRPDGRRGSLVLNHFQVEKLIPAKDASGKIFYDKWSVLDTSFPVKEGKPVIVGISNKKDDGVVLAVMLLKKK
ncbi:MAG: hypothetical protein CO090_03270 [Acidobacteria bacterium CG_4_9_14_3_um_filter_49_7]|nr:MAG: hypothetical protein CO090_03270 [Acidobacteria bacterium CG_4_9_14_3_um_filter_49_7]